MLPRLLLWATERGDTSGAADISARCSRLLLGGRMKQLYDEAMAAAPLAEPLSPDAPDDRRPELH